jgi:hypothetical protein
MRVPHMIIQEIQDELHIPMELGDLHEAHKHLPAIYRVGSR